MCGLLAFSSCLDSLRFQSATESYTLVESPLSDWPAVSIRPINSLRTPAQQLLTRVSACSHTRDTVGVPADACRYACAPFGGLVAVWPEPNPKQLLPASLEPVVVVTSPGYEHHVVVGLKDISFQGEKLGALVGAGWVDSEQLVCVFQTGRGRVFTPMGALRPCVSHTQFSLSTHALCRALSRCARMWSIAPTWSAGCVCPVAKSMLASAAAATGRWRVA